MIAIACDHAGIDLKPHVVAVLDELGIPYKDFGTNGHESVDYPIYVSLLIICSVDILHRISFYIFHNHSALFLDIRNNHHTSQF